MTITPDFVEDIGDDVLTHAQRDLLEVIEAQEALARVGHPVPKLGAYWDELFTVTEELNRRARPEAA